MSDEPKSLEISTTWEVIYRPYPAFLEREGFEMIFEKVGDVLVDRFEPLAKMWGDVGLSGHFDKEIVFSISEPDRSPEPEMGVFAVVSTIDDFQNDVCHTLRYLGLEGHTFTQRIVSVGPE